MSTSSILSMPVTRISSIRRATGVPAELSETRAREQLRSRHQGELLNKRLNVAAAVFRLEQTNLPKVDDSIPYSATNACGGNCYIAADKVVSQGDLSANGEIAPGWNVTTGYTFVNSKYATGENEGQRYMTSLPRHSLRLASAYKLPGTSWTVGGNVTAYSKAYTDGTS